MARVTLDRVTKRFGKVTAVSEATLDIADREFLVLVGPSGCGKSTLLRMIAGLEEITGGEVRIGDRVVNDLAPKDRDIAMVFQNYALYPHMDVYKNMAFGLKMRGHPKDEIDQRVREAAAILEIEPLLSRKPAQLSGGQRQRVAMGRAIVRKPAVFLFDEPLSNLDAKLRVQMRLEIKRLHKRLETTIVYVTHDQVEAMTLADRVAIIKDGVLQQAAPPLEVYDKPANAFVAGFMGSPGMNFLAATVEAEGETLVAKGDGFALALPARFRAIPDLAGRPLTLGIRPERICIEGWSKAPNAPLAATVEVTEPVGSEIYTYIRVGPQLLAARTKSENPPTVGRTSDWFVDADSIKLFDTETGRNLVDG